MTRSIYYTATSLDGFIATTEHSLDWLLRQDNDPEGSFGFEAFVPTVGAVVMGRRPTAGSWTTRTVRGRTRSRPGCCPPDSYPRSTATSASPVATSARSTSS